MGTADAFQPSRTHHAAQGAEISELVERKFAGRTFGGSVRRCIQVRNPDGPSTDAGRKARQAILLVPEHEGESSAVMCGWLDASRRVAELRPFSSVRTFHVRRFEREIDLPEAEYEAATEALRLYLSLQAFEVTFEAPLESHDASRNRAQSLRRSISTLETPSSVEHERPSESWGWMLLAALVGFGVCYLLVLLGIIG
ncbi:MAG: hypothetical protein H6729_16330 [Deltaproteobacteria bacterium]|nr:hypothetical protein [Deltaproteobacteria bacterium]